MQIEKLDFVGVPSTDAERSKAFYVDTLGLRQNGQNEFWAGETCFGVWEPTSFGMEFAPQQNGHLALHVDDVAEARKELEAKASSSRATSSTPASATWPSSPIPMATTDAAPPLRPDRLMSTN